MSDDTYFDPNEELDFEGDGLQTQRVDMQITEAGLEMTDAGQRWFAILEPIGQEIEGLINNQARDGGYLVHEERPELVRIGRGTLKRLGKAALGTSKFRIDELAGSVVNVQLSEDDAGFARVRGPRAVKV